MTFFVTTDENNYIKKQVYIIASSPNYIEKTIIEAVQGAHAYDLKSIKAGLVDKINSHNEHNPENMITADILQHEFSIIKKGNAGFISANIRRRTFIEMAVNHVSVTDAGIASAHAAYADEHQ